MSSFAAAQAQMFLAELLTGRAASLRRSKANFGRSTAGADWRGRAGAPAPWLTARNIYTVENDSSLELDQA
jgi:hypothetical protein